MKDRVGARRNKNNNLTKGGIVNFVSPGTLIPLLIAGALGLHVLVMIGMVHIATSNDSYAVEPDYYAKALAWDDRRAQERVNAELGWVLDFVVEPAPTGADPILRVAVTDGVGQPIPDADVVVEAFSNRRRDDVHTATLVPSGSGYSASMPMRGSGRWEFRFTAVRGENLFTYRETRHVWTHVADPS